MPKTISPKILTPADVRAVLTKNLDFDKDKFPKVLWPYRGDVETGSVLHISDDGDVDISWLEGYKSRNDTVKLSEVLAVHDPKGPEMLLSPFSGPGYLTEAGLKWQQEHPQD